MSSPRARSLTQLPLILSGLIGAPFCSPSFSGSTPFSCASGICRRSGPTGLTSFAFSSLSSSLRFFFAACCCSRSGLLRGEEILPFGGRRGLGKRCFCGKSSSSTNGSSRLARNLLRKKSCTRPIWLPMLSVLIGS